ncbi:MAG: sigma-70 family RNA polymerase sigma factor [Blastocatellia bacterium]|nr:sigma-70 family RNA polymerase sigma factor [Blastocatellia bacterium]
MSETPSVRRNKKQRLLTVEVFDGLLVRLDADRDQASIKYEELRLSLITYFATRGAADPNELADETLNRVAYRLAEGQVIMVNNPIYYALAVARNIWREQLAQPFKTVSLTTFTDAPQVQVVSPEDLLLEFEQRLRTDQKYDCFRHCLAQLSETDHVLLIEYYQGKGQANSKNRQALAQRFGLTLGSLRNRISRIRDRLSNCLQNCLENENKV